MCRKGVETSKERKTKLAYLMIWCGCAVRVVARVGTSASTPIAGTSHACPGTTTPVAGAVVVVAEVGFRVPFVDHEVDGHFALQTADVTLTKVVAQFVNLWKKRKRKAGVSDEMMGSRE